MSNNGPPQELEIKLALPGPEDAAKLASALGAPRSDVIQHNRFYDTKDGDLAALRKALRLRREHPVDNPDLRRFILTIKGPAIRALSAVRRMEQEQELSPEQVRLLSTGDLTFEQLPNGAPIPELAPLNLAQLNTVVEFRNRRRSYPIALGGQDLRLELDETTFEDTITEYEIEVELDAATDPSQIVLMQIELGLLLDRNGVAYNEQSRGKYSRALGHRSRST